MYTDPPKSWALLFSRELFILLYLSLCVSSFRGYSVPKKGNNLFLFIVIIFILFFFFILCAAADRHAQEAQNMKTVTVRRHVTDLTASTPFAKPPVSKMKDQLGDTSNNISKFNITSSLFSRLYTGFSRKELQLMYRSFKQVIAKKKIHDFFNIFDRPHFPYIRVAMYVPNFEWLFSLISGAFLFSSNISHKMVSRSMKTRSRSTQRQRLIIYKMLTPL